MGKLKINDNLYHSSKTLWDMQIAEDNFGPISWIPWYNQTMLVSKGNPAVISWIRYDGTIPYHGFVGFLGIFVVNNIEALSGMTGKEFIFGVQWDPNDESNTHPLGTHRENLAHIPVTEGVTVYPINAWTIIPSKITSIYKPFIYQNFSNTSISVTYYIYRPRFDDFKKQP